MAGAQILEDWDLWKRSGNTIADLLNQADIDVELLIKNIAKTYSTTDENEHDLAIMEIVDSLDNEIGSFLEAWAYEQPERRNQIARDQIIDHQIENRMAEI